MLEYVSIESIALDDEADTYDISNNADDYDEPNFLIDGVVVHNCIPEYVERRDDISRSWVDDEHPAVTKILSDTYNVCIYQESLAALWQGIAGFTGPEAQEARKAVAKKWKEKLKPIEEKWIKGATPVIGLEAATKWWGKMVTFGRYAFNKCLGENTKLKDVDTGEELTVRQWFESGRHPRLLSYNNGVVPDQCIEIIDSGEQEVYEIEFDDGTIEQLTLDHKLLCDDGQYHEVREIVDEGLEVVSVRSQCN